MAEQGQVWWATGRRKTSVARVRVLPGNGTIMVNDRDVAGYFARETLTMIVNQPFDVTSTGGRFNVLAKVEGGGVAAQAEALRLGISRALVDIDGDHRPALKKAGLLTRDARAVERKKYGHHKARKSPQYSKR